MEQVVTQLVTALAESLGGVLVLMVPIGLLYGKAFKKYTWLTLVVAIPISVLLHAVATAVIVSASPSMPFIIGVGACVVGLELASVLIKQKKPETPA